MNSFGMRPVEYLIASYRNWNRLKSASYFNCMPDETVLLPTPIEIDEDGWYINIALP